MMYAVLWHIYANKVPLVQSISVDVYLAYYLHTSVLPADNE